MNEVNKSVKEDRLIHCSAFFGSEDHVVLDRIPGLGYNTLLLQLILGIHVATDFNATLRHSQLQHVCRSVAACMLGSCKYKNP